MRPTVLCVAGARPNFIKIKPVLDALERRGADARLVHTGQHYDESMNDVFFRDLGLRAPDHHLGAGSGSHAEQTARVMTAFEKLVDEVRPDAVVVVGDVNSTLACALVGAKAEAVVAHVEAGLRSRDWGMPEEVNRMVADRVSDLLFAPSPDAVENLRAEGYHEDQIVLAGNVMIDTLYANLDRALGSGMLHRHGLTPGGYGVVTLHRPSNVDDPAHLARLLDALGQVELPLIWPVHPRTAAKLESVGLPANLTAVAPAGYLDFVALQASARLVLTDSGGVQEETTALGVPCLTLRENTERPITVSEGTNLVIGTDPRRIVTAAGLVLADPPAKRTPVLWDGHAGARIADALMAHLGSEVRHRPTDLRPAVTPAS
ncbi:UDP-N-acetylglucosamine 2-epimerase (non-hydrolyzing) [Virgisporangium aliadipatigenens]|uniref:UDP-N-acetylglucosamine 2-epimerase (Non-hydrolyzing) n=1 Tax=Virgisporangium aliadipatigenens TaxID=741659 RepID=A0A8J4DNM1_9ACTN|nr:UDP-N-acetylglucosamine 2-epimerase (non-hydrolyzing) [Virgisporangium aliadipatigenens]GIJ44574.1 UDP-N-acetylglucosamine 2-epimerase (non-hydrolyzing) [Virgisporangium aliadipatigenens]